MLVLTRKKTESIQIADAITITILEIRGDRVRVGIDAPRDIPILRTELHDCAASTPVRRREVVCGTW